jgi:hypothetical protein
MRPPPRRPGEPHNHDAFSQNHALSKPRLTYGYQGSASRPRWRQRLPLTGRLLRYTACHDYAAPTDQISHTFYRDPPPFGGARSPRPTTWSPVGSPMIGNAIPEWTSMGQWHHGIDGYSKPSERGCKPRRRDYCKSRLNLRPRLPPPHMTPIEAVVTGCGTNEALRSLSLLQQAMSPAELSVAQARAPL